MDRAELKGLLRDWGAVAFITLVVAVTWNIVTAPASTGLAPKLELDRLGRGTWSLHDNGKADAYVVNFWATWCGPCKTEIPELNAFAAAHPDVAVIGVSVDEQLQTTRLEAAARQLGIAYPVMHDFDQSNANRWGVRSYPTTFILDRDKNIVRSHVGVINKTMLEEMVP